jgi:hypothetical protein
VIAQAEQTLFNISWRDVESLFDAYRATKLGRKEKLFVLCVRQGCLWGYYLLIDKFVCCHMIGHHLNKIIKCFIVNGILTLTKPVQRNRQIKKKDTLLAYIRETDN